MSNKRNEITNFESSSLKIQPVFSELTEVERQILPGEMITMIIFQLNETKDLKNCMLSSKFIQDLMLKTPEIMRKIKYSFRANIKKKEISKFFSEKGKFIRKIEIKNLIGPDSDGFYQYIMKSNQYLIPYIANRTPNLEEFSCKDYFFSQNSVNYTPFYMPRLKHLSLNDQMLNFITNARNIENLETLTFQSDVKYEIVVNFLCQQQTLKELTVHDDSLFKFRDFSNEVKFNLTKFKLLSDFTQKRQNFINFLKRQAGSLEELIIRGQLYMELYEIIFKKDNCLKKLNSLFFFLNSAIFENVSTDWMLSSLTHFDGGILKLNLVYTLFPNLVSLKCFELKNAEGTFDKLESLEVARLRYCKIQNCKFPNLKNLSVSSIIGEFYCEEFARIVPKLENFKISKASNFLRFSEALKSLKYFVKIKNIEIFDRFTKNKVSINTISKVIELSENFFECRHEILNFLGENFKKFNFMLKICEDIHFPINELAEFVEGW